MRLRVFSISLLIGLISAVLVTWLNVSYSKIELMDLVDDRLREVALSLVHSELAELRRGEYEEVEEIISEELGPQRIGKIFILRNDKGDILFQSQSANTLKHDIPRSPQWITIEEPEGRLLRVLNLKLPKVQNRTLQVGTLLDSDSPGWDRPGRSTWIYAIAVIAVIALASFMSAALVMRPFRRLHRHLTSISEDLSRFRPVSPIPEKEFRAALRSRGDEFGQTVRLLNGLIERINRASAFTRLWSVRLAHELKTPITILRLEAEDSSLKPEGKQAMLNEVDRMSKMVGDFLSWAEAGMATSGPEPAPRSIADAASQTVTRLGKLAPGRLSLLIEGDWLVSILPDHLETLITNLIENALKYSPSDSPVAVRVQPGRFEVRDRGEGLPEKIREHLGLPFNRGSERPTPRTPSTGLGLALVETLCRRYGLKLRFTKADGEHVVSVSAS